jgi:NTP pyrophosphatase (non-canonical NTP hydrolase)
MNIRKLQIALTNGENPYTHISDVKGVLNHYVEEVGELMRAVRKGELDAIQKELGDQLIMLCVVSSSLGIDLQTATIEKIENNIKQGKFRPESHKGLKDLFLRD